ncbi:hypothetical protein SKTS_22950 [Sulfurimicrobium lacus]|uniref:UPF0033 domain-containing protein n=1 Tax=Sulfurimicrobium lacus TaxID=2715678 RepID=A0A6F8VFB2_9PROT|nr:sulfurtransferase TusA family protein [Sulfurimicrobium lacus]BCB27409.1 hypothetical protein SKTS_22950 [Sulfurimicrobium lacus]
MGNETLIKPNIVVDMTGLVCPHPLLGAKRVLDDMKTGEVLLLKSNCPGTRDDLFSWAKATGNEVVRSEKSTEGVTEYYVRKGKKAALMPHVTLDVTGMVCPGPVIEARRFFNTMVQGQIMKLVSTCSSTRDEVGTWCAATGNVLLDTLETGPGVWTFFIRKG